MYDNIACDPQKEVTLKQIIKDGHDALCEIEADVDAIGLVLFGINMNEQKKDDHPSSIDVALADDVNTERRITQKLAYIIERL